MSSNIHGKFSKSKLSLLGHRFVREIQPVTGGHFTAQVSVVFIRSSHKSGKWWWSRV